MGVPQLTMPTYILFIIPGAWLPVDLHLTTNAYASKMSTHVILFLVFVALAFVIYLLCAWHIHHQPAQGDYRRILRVVWLVTIIIGLVFVMMPAMLSHDVFVYAGYGRVLTIHHANPYFVTLSAYPQDPFIVVDDWKNAPAAYGPVWLAISGLCALLIGDDPARALLVYRSFALIAHLLNILLVMHMLRDMGRSPRVVALGTLLYAWNPLVLEESSLGAHNDVFMVTLILLGIFFSVRAERNEFSYLPRLRNYLPSLIAFTLAMLIKFTAAPIIALYLILLASKAYHSKTFEASIQPHTLLRRLQAMLLVVLPAGLISGAIVLTLYAPYWLGSSIESIVYSFTSPPSANSSDGSILYAIIEWVQVHGLPPTNSWTYTLLYVLALHQTWNYINFATMACMMIVSAIWLWRSPTTRTLVLAAVATLGALLIVTFWFFPWYITWLVGLIVVCLPVTYDRVGRALVAFTLTFSASAFFIYLFSKPLPPLGGWIGFDCLTTIGPPLLMLLIFLLLPLVHKGGENASFTQ